MDKSYLSKIQYMTSSNVQQDLIFTKRELELLNLLAIGYSQKQIAERYNIGYCTARQHVKSMLYKINAPNSAALIRKSIEGGYLSICQELPIAS